MSGKKISINRKIDSDLHVKAVEFISSGTGISKLKIKDAMNKGACVIRKERGPARRLRKATAILRKGDTIEFNYDEDILKTTPAEAICLNDLEDYSIWFKPAGMLSSGTKYGDHCSLLRRVELFFGGRRKVFLVHRLDREVCGVMAIAHTKRAAADLSRLFSRNIIEKVYRAEVIGEIGRPGDKGRIDLPLDNIASVTEYSVISYSAEADISLLDIVIKTGRLHQIRRHFEMVGHPVIGDPKYGTGNKNTAGLRLYASSLGFVCPCQKKYVEYKVPLSLQPF